MISTIKFGLILVLQGLTRNYNVYFYSYQYFLLVILRTAVVLNF